MPDDLMPDDPVEALHQARALISAGLFRPDPGLTNTLVAQEVHAIMTDREPAYLAFVLAAVCAVAAELAVQAAGEDDPRLVLASVVDRLAGPLEGR